MTAQHIIVKDDEPKLKVEGFIKHLKVMKKI